MATGWLAQLREFAAYNAWANARLYAAVGALTEADRRADHGAAFGSLHGTLNHLLVADRIWMARFEGTASPGYALDAELFDDFDALRAARVAEDARIAAHLDGLSAEDLAGEIAYTRVSRPEPVRQGRGGALTHFFNHQTHHRGQAHALLTRLGVEAPALDLLFFQRDANPAKG